MLRMHVNVIMVGQLDEHLIFWPHHLYSSICYCTVPCLVFELEIKYDDEEDDDKDLESYLSKTCSFYSITLQSCWTWKQLADMGN